MKMKESGRRWALLIGLSLLLGMGCASMSTQERSLQGVWYASGQIPQTRLSWQGEWTFAQGAYKQTGYPPISVTGRYEILSVQKGALKVRLFKSKGTFPNDRTYVIQLLPAKRQIKIGNRLLTRKKLSRAAR